ncbi:MAG: nuclear transport factor 2 family protein [Pedococcus sp.]
MTHTMLQEVLRALSTAFRTRDVEGLLRLFSTTATVTYAGSESGEKATGPSDLRCLLTDLLGRPEAYSFEFDDITFGERDGLVWLMADGTGTETSGDAATQTFPYRLTGVLTRERSQWRWLLLAGSEPTPGAAPALA